MHAQQCLRLVEDARLDLGSLPRSMNTGKTTHAHSPDVTMREWHIDKSIIHVPGGASSLCPRHKASTPHSDRTILTDLAPPFSTSLACMRRMIRPCHQFSEIQRVMTSWFYISLGLNTLHNFKTIWEYLCASTRSKISVKRVVSHCVFESNLLGYEWSDMPPCMPKHVV